MSLKRENRRFVITCLLLHLGAVVAAVVGAAVVGAAVVGAANILLEQ